MQAEASRPRATSTPIPATDADIMKFIHQKAAEIKAKTTLGVVGEIG